MASQDWFEKDFYAILGVPQDADQAAIKKAYRKLARAHHPDQNAGDAAAEQRFKDIGEANSVLSDPEKRREYDAVRQMARGGARFTAGGPGGGAGGFDDVFSTMFGGGGRGGGPRVRKTNGGGADPSHQDKHGRILRAGAGPA
jgi:molecular chaperone DnaJ